MEDVWCWLRFHPAECTQKINPLIESKQPNDWLDLPAGNKLPPDQVAWQFSA